MVCIRRARVTSNVDERARLARLRPDMGFSVLCQPVCVYFYRLHCVPGLGGARLSGGV